MSHVFQPFWGVPFTDFGQQEQQFFQSLKNLCDLYGWQSPDVSGLPFPQNVTAVLEKLSEQQFGGVTCMLLQDKGSPAKLATVKTFNTNYCLYYIPLRPLWYLKNAPERQAEYELAKTLFAYLYQTIGVPYYREPGYLDNTYDALENWIKEIDQEGNEDADEDEFRQRQFTDYELLKNAGDSLLPELKQPFTPTQWEQQIKAFHPQNGGWRDLQEVAEELLKLAKDHPARAVKDTMHYELNETDGSDQIYWENYISFFWSHSDCLQEMLFEMVNNEFQEMGYQEEPTAIQYFDTPQEKPCHDFDFETRLFALMDALTGVLNNYDDEKRQSPLECL